MVTYSDTGPEGSIAYLVPEFPGQTHIWIWREVTHMREWGVDIQMFSTRSPDRESAARHAFAGQARAETVYLWPMSMKSVAAAVAWAAVTQRHRLLRAAAVPLTLDGMSLRQRIATVPLLAVACVLAREVASKGLKHVHVHSAARSAVIAMMTQRLVGIPYSISLSANLEWWGGGMASKLGDADFTVLHAGWLRGQVLRDYPRLGSNRVLLGRVGVDTLAWVPGERRARDSTFHLVTVARLHHAKGHDVLLRSVARLRDSGRDLRLTIVGSGPEREALEVLAARLGIDPVVEFTGSLPEDEIITLLRAADAFALASRFEPLGVVYMEAMAIGLPTIGTNAGGVPEIITDGHDGLLVPPEDEERLAAAIARIMDDPELRLELGANARRTVVERFDSRRGAAVLYERLFGSPPSARTEVEVTR